MDGNEDFLASFEMAKSKIAATRNLVEKNTTLLRKTKKENEASQVAARRLVEEKEVMATDKKKVEEEVVWLRQDLQNLRVGFVTQKEDLEADYQKQVEDMFFYNYRCCIKKHGIAQDTPSSPSDDKDKFLGDLTQGEGQASRGSPSGEWASLFIFIYYDYLWPGLLNL